VLAEVTRRARGAIDVTFRSHGRRIRFTAPIRDGRIRIDRRLHGRQRRGSGIVSLRWRGSGQVRAAAVRLRAADQPARLRIGEAAVRAGRLIASGSVSSRARGVVRLRLAYVDAGRLRARGFSARIAHGRWRVSALVPAAALAGGDLTVVFTGLEHARGGPMRGEQDARQISAG
jgi:acyl dehydratase